MTVCHALLEALARGQLVARTTRHLVVPADCWWNRPGFRWSFELGLAWMPRMPGLPRRAALRLEQRGFEAWVLSLPPLSEAAEQLTPAERCRRLLGRELGDPARAGWRKADWLRHCRQAISRLSKHAFERAWRESPEQHRPRVGRPRGGKNPPAAAPPPGSLSRRPR